LTGVRLASVGVRLASVGVRLTLVRVCLASVGVRFTSVGVRLASAGVRLMLAGVRLSSAGVRLASAGVRLSRTGAGLLRTGARFPRTGVRLTSAGVRLSSTGVRLSSTGVRLSSTGVRLPRTGAGLTRTGVCFPRTGAGLLRTGVGLSRATPWVGRAVRLLTAKVTGLGPNRRPEGRIFEIEARDCRGGLQVGGEVFEQTERRRFPAGRFLKEKERRGGPYVWSLWRMRTSKRSRPDPKTLTATGWIQESRHRTIAATPPRPATRNRSPTSVASPCWTEFEAGKKRTRRGSCGRCAPWCHVASGDR
jgi:hypothetical protein